MGIGVTMGMCLVVGECSLAQVRHAGVGGFQDSREIIQIKKLNTRSD